MNKKLTPELIALRAKSDKIKNIKNLNVWGSEISDCSILQKMPLLEIISLSVNKIKTLKYFQNMVNLQELYLRKNLISSFNEINYLKTCPKLKILWLNENPISYVPGYRLGVIHFLPNLQKLDDNDVDFDEKEIARNVDINNLNMQVNNAYNNAINKNNNDANNKNNNNNNNVLMNSMSSIRSDKNEINNNSNKREFYYTQYNRNNNNKNLQNFYSDNNINNFYDNFFNNNNNNIPNNFSNDFSNRNDYNYNNNNYNDNNYNNNNYNYNNNNNYQYQNYNPNNNVNYNNNYKNNNYSQSPSSQDNALNCILILLNELNQNQLEYLNSEISKKIYK